MLDQRDHAAVTDALVGCFRGDLGAFTADTADSHFRRLYRPLRKSAMMAAYKMASNGDHENGAKAHVSTLEAKKECQ
jgi:hypothetical protein